MGQGTGHCGARWLTAPRAAPREQIARYDGAERGPVGVRVSRRTRTLARHAHVRAFRPLPAAAAAVHNSAACAHTHTHTQTHTNRGVTPRETTIAAAAAQTHKHTRRACPRCFQHTTSCPPRPRSHPRQIGANARRTGPSALPESPRAAGVTTRRGPEQNARGRRRRGTHPACATQGGATRVTGCCASPPHVIGCETKPTLIK